MTAKTGEKCPVSGVWKVDGFPTTTAPIAKGNTMPPYCGKAVGSPDKPGGLSIQLCKSEKKEFYIRYSS